MAIKMQGTWLVRVKAKNAAFPQEFIVSGASSGNGTYPGTQATEIFVSGPSWTIAVRHNPGPGFRHSQLKVKFPTTSGGFHQFDLQSNDSGNDQDFDDLVLTCRTPVGANTHLIFGHVSDYAGPCLFNRCFPIWVIDTPGKLRAALRIPKLRDYLLEIDPEIVSRIPLPFPPDPIGPVALNPQPLPPLAAFTPVVVPFPGELATPLKQRFLVRTALQNIALPDFKTGKTLAADALENIEYQAIKERKALPANPAFVSVADLKRRAGLESIVAKFRFCDADTLANVRVRFWEYDRTAAEKSGGAYTGEGERQYLGSTFTDDFGNYVFRFETQPSDTTDEILNDLAPGENAFIAQAPDVIAEVMQPLDPTAPAFSTAPYWNVPALQRINICVPREKIGIRPLPCNGQHILQGVGNIPLAAPDAFGVRDGAGNVLTHLGIVTSTNSLGPNTDCAAWHGTLLLRGCLNLAQVKFYTLEHRTPGGGWQPLDVKFSLPRFFGAFLSSQQVSQGIINGKATYLNVETDGNDWLAAYRNIKAQIPTTVFPENGPREIRISGLDASLNPVANTTETLTLFILNNGIELAIKPEISMVGGGAISECGLFNLPAGVENPEILVRFKAQQSFAPPVFGGFGFMGGYGLHMQKGASFFATTNPGSPENPKSYAPAAGRGLGCDMGFSGTRDEASAVADFVEIRLSPAASEGARWLQAHQTFCTFGVFLNGHLRRTDGQSANWNSSAVPVLFGIQR